MLSKYFLQPAQMPTLAHPLVPVMTVNADQYLHERLVTGCWLKLALELGPTTAHNTSDPAVRSAQAPAQAEEGYPFCLPIQLVKSVMQGSLLNSLLGFTKDREYTSGMQLVLALCPQIRACQCKALYQAYPGGKHLQVGRCARREGGKHNTKEGMG